MSTKFDRAFSVNMQRAGKQEWPRWKSDEMKMKMKTEEEVARIK